MSIKGQIHSIKLKNFVTFYEIEYEPEAHLNILTGPNGSGKSTIVSAIALGMGGEPKILARSNKIGDFVKNNETEAFIKICIYKDASHNTVSFERNFNKDGKSIFKIDSVTVSGKEYLKQIKSFNIHVDNLCQFLPQDRVQDFAKLNPQEIFAQTQESVCPPELIQMTSKLNELRLSQLNDEDNLVKNKEKLKAAEDRLNEIQKEVDKINEKSKTEGDLKVCQSKKSWLEIEIIAKKLLAIKEDLLKANKYVERDEQAQKSIKERSSGLLTQVAQLTQQQKIEQSKVLEFEHQFDSLNGKHLDCKSQIRILKNQLEEKQKDEEQRERELFQIHQLITVEEKDLDNILNESGPEESRDLKIKQLDQALSELKNEVRLIMFRNDKINKDLDNDFIPEIQRYRRNIERIENVAEQKMNFLRDKFPQVYSAVMWLRSNRSKFAGKIFEPMILELNITNPENAKYFENTISNRDLLAFTCTDKRDMSNLLQCLCTEKNLKINILHSELEENCSYKTGSVEKFRQLGFHSFLLDLVDGPAPILNYLCKIYQLHNILIGTEEANQYTDHVPNNIRLYYAGNNRYSISVSKYSGEVSSMRNAISSSHMMSMSTNKVELEKLKTMLNEKLKQTDVLKNERTQFEAKINHLEAKRNDIQSTRRELEAFKLEVDTHKEKLKALMRRADRIKNDACDIDAEKAKFDESAKKTVNTQVGIIKEQVICFGKLQNAIESHQLFTTRLSILKTENSDIENEIKNAEENLLKSQRLQKSVNSSLIEANKEYQTKLHETKKQCNWKSPKEKGFPFRKEFRSLPDDMVAIDAMICDLQARVEIMSTGNQDVLEDYEKRKSYIASLQEMIKTTSGTHKNLEKEIDEIHMEWYPKIMEYVDTIRNNFSKFMRSMNYTGDIKLIRKADNDYQSYGIQILVQYRPNVPLKVLDRNVQSGGERAVAIATYTLALQHLSNAPFRCVDEINQGMDPENERKILNMIIEQTVADENNSQYFFVTPKLRLTANYQEKTSITVVNNGKLIPKGLKLDDFRMDGPMQVDSRQQ